MFGIAVAGMVLGHFVTYLIAFPQQHHRDLVLQVTGHDYLSAFTHAALVLAMAGAVAIVVRACNTPERGSVSTFASLAGTLALVQVSAFVGQEVLERVVAGAPLGDLGSPLLAIGVIAQVTVAVAGSAITVWLAMTSDRLARVADSARVRFWHPDPLVMLASASESSDNADIVAARRTRAPPSF